MKVKKRQKEVLMPKNRKEETIYTIMMVIVMVYAMVCYNIAMDVGGMKNFVFLAALSELPIMCIAAFLLDTFIAGPIAKKVAFRLLNPKEDKPIFVILAISVLSIWLMCPMMSFVAVVLFKKCFWSTTYSSVDSDNYNKFSYGIFLAIICCRPAGKNDIWKNI